MPLVFLLSMVVLASSASLDDGLCAKGEGLWCQSLAFAEACGTVDHCKETIWKNLIVEEDESNVCLFCGAVISDARKMSAGGQTEDEVMNFLSSASDLLPDVVKASQIKKTIQSKSLQGILNSEIAPQMVCSLLAVCKGLPVEEDTHKMESSAKETPEQPELADDDSPMVPSSCTDCTKFFASLKSLIANDTPNFLTDIILDEGCARAGAYKKMCEELVKLYVPNTITILIKLLDPATVCRAIKMCPKSQTENQNGALDTDFSSVEWEEWTSLLNENPQPRREDGLRQPSSCADCTKFFNSLKNFLKSDTPPFLQDVILDQVCSRLGTRKTQCEELVKTWLTSIIEMAVNYLDPNQLCQLTRMCKKTRSQFNLNSISWTKLTTPNETKEASFVPQMLRVSSSCTDCTKFFASVRDLLKGDASTFLTDVLMDTLCPLTGKFQKECNDFAKTYLPMAIGLVANSLDPVKICKAINMCKKSQDEVDFDPILIDLSSIDWEALIGNKGDSKTACETCKMGVQAVQTFIKSETVQTYIEVFVGKIVCVRLGPFRTTCEKLVKTELRMVLNLIARQLDPSTVCRLFRLCQALDVVLEEEDSFPVLEESEPLGQVECTVCETVISLVRAAIDNNKTEEEILMAMHGLCTHLPSTQVIAVCHTFLNNYGARVIDAIRQQLQPRDICVKLRLCTVLNFNLLDAAEMLDSEPCYVCRAIVQYLEAYIGQTDTVSMIQDQLKTLCHSLHPLLEKKLCIPFVEVYIPRLLYELSVCLPPKFFCTKIRICSD